MKEYTNQVAVVVGDNIPQVIDKKSMSAKGLAAYAGVSYTHLQRY